MTLLQIFASLLNYKARLLLLILGSVALYALVTNLYHHGLRRPHSRLGRLVGRLGSWPHHLWLFQLLRFLFCVGIPYLALLQGVTSLRLLGLSDLDWIEGVGAGVPLGLGAFLLLWWGWSHYFRSLGRKQKEKPRLAEVRTLFQPWGWPLILLEVLCLEAHWAFYRSGPILLLGEYWGVFGGLGIIFLEWATNPALREGLNTDRGGDTLWEGSLALVMAIIFLFTKNLWLCMAIHLGLEMGLLTILGRLHRLRGESTI